MGTFRSASARSARLVVPMAGAAAIALAMCGVAAEAPASAAASQSVLTIGMAGPPLTWPGAATGGGLGNQNETADTLDYAPLINLTPAGGYSPWLATKWGYIGSGYKTFYMNLRHGVKFSNGQPFNADAVKGWIEYVFKSQLGAWSANLKSLKSVTAPNAYEVVVHLRRANANLPYIFGPRDSNFGLPGCPAAVANPSMMTGTVSCGAGPYEIESSATVVGNSYTYVPNPYYYDKSAQKWSSIVVKVIPTPSSMLAALETGQIQVAVGDSSTVTSAAGLPNIKVVKGFAASWGLNLFNRRSGPLSKLLVRQALNYAVNRAALTKAIVGPGSQPTSQLYNYDALSKKAQNYYQYNPRKARQLLARAGYKHGFTLNVLEIALGADFSTLGAGIASDLQKIGVKVNVTVLPPTDFAVAPSYLKTGKYDASYLVVPSGPMLTAYQTAFVPGGSENYLNLTNPPLIDVYNQALRSTDPAPLWRQMGLVIAQQAYTLPIAFGANYYYVDTTKVGGVVAPNSREGLAFASEWYPVG